MINKLGFDAKNLTSNILCGKKVLPMVILDYGK
jgi:hypothetical protein